MSREQRVSDNPGLLYAQSLALKRKVDFSVVFTLTDNYPGAVLRHYDFMIRGLYDVAKRLEKLKIPFVLLRGDPVESFTSYIKQSNTGEIIVDFDPLKIKQQWISGVIANTVAKFIEVDGHNIVPARQASDKLEYGAYTLRPKIHRQLHGYLEDLPELKPMATNNFRGFSFEPGQLIGSMKLDKGAGPVQWPLPGEEHARKLLRKFIAEKMPAYSEKRNDPNADHTSNLSPYLHFGQIFSGRIASEVIRNHASDENSEAFLGELIVRKELSDNFCLFNPDYDNVNGFHEWAKKTHMEHERDEREFIYSLEQFERAITHDPLWNAAQTEMVSTGKMHGYMRMYWAKKILEWTASAEDAMKTAIYLNDRYELDGRDPNGYAGIAWSIGGVHDRAWTERPVFGKIRYMNDKGCRRKFDVNAYINRIMHSDKREQ
ncbi:MAG: deoxyribodipyrimidine photo-lyase [Bacteroidales bacterium]|nr:deoxyribodipyrimidine photo-lyase [Bacteroidales bacterium]